MCSVSELVEADLVYEHIFIDPLQGILDISDSEPRLQLLFQVVQALLKRLLFRAQLENLLVFGGQLDEPIHSVLIQVLGFQFVPYFVEIIGVFLQFRSFDLHLVDRCIEAHILQNNLFPRRIEDIKV